MPFAIRKVRGQDKYKVFNKDTGAVHSKATSLANARKQVRLLYMVERKKIQGGANPYMDMNFDSGVTDMEESSEEEVGEENEEDEEENEEDNEPNELDRLLNTTREHILEDFEDAFYRWRNSNQTQADVDSELEIFNRDYGEMDNWRFFLQEGVLPILIRYRHWVLTLRPQPQQRRVRMRGGNCCGMCRGNGCGNCGDYSEGEDDKEINGGGLPAGDLKELLKRSYDKKPSSFGDYKLDTQLSGQRVQVYWNAKMGKAIVVHRGTKGIQDVMTDVRYTLGDKSSKRFKHAKDIQKKANAKYGKENVITAGHSLGSVLGETAVKGQDQELITLNKPVGLADVGKKVSKKQTDIKTSLDPVSILRGTQRGNAPVVLKSKSYNPLAEHSTETLGRVNEDLIFGEGVENNLHNMYMPKISSDSQFVYIPQVRQQIFGSGVGRVQYGPNTGIVKQVHLKGYGMYGAGIQAPPSRLPVGSPLK